MQKFPEEKLEKLIKEEKWEDVKKELGDWLASETDTDRQADQLLLAASIYARVRTELGKAYLKNLDELKTMLENIKKEGKQLQDLEKGQKIKNKIKDL